MATEMNLNVLADNLRQVMNILGICNISRSDQISRAYEPFFCFVLFIIKLAVQRS